MASAAQWNTTATAQQRQSGRGTSLRRCPRPRESELIPLFDRSIDVEEVDIERPAVGTGQLPMAADFAGDAERRCLGFSVSDTDGLLVVRNRLIAYDDRQMPLSTELRNFNDQVG